MASVLSIEQIQGLETGNNSHRIDVSDGHTLAANNMTTTTLYANNLSVDYGGDEPFISYNPSTNQMNFASDFTINGSRSDFLNYPGAIIQRVVKMIKTDFTYSTGGAYNQYFAHASCFRTKITSKQPNSAFYVRMGLNGEPNSTHNWTMYPVRSLVDTGSVNIVDWDHDIARHLDDGENVSTTYKYYCFGYTNIGNYPDTDYNSTPIQTATMEFIDTPNVAAGTDIWFSLVMMSSGNHTFYVNRSVNASVGGAYERGVSYITIEELAGPVQITEVESGIIEYTF